jgi:hypothetical protein
MDTHSIMDTALHILERRVAYTLVDMDHVLERASSWSNTSTADCPYSTPYVEALYGSGTHRSLNEVKKTVAGAAHQAKRALEHIRASILTNPDLAQVHIDGQTHALSENLIYISALLRIMVIMQWGGNRESARTRDRFSSLVNTPKRFFSSSFDQLPGLPCKTT